MSPLLIAVEDYHDIEYIMKSIVNNYFLNHKELGTIGSGSKFRYVALIYTEPLLETEIQSLLDSNNIVLNKA